jgi:predicted methyltransferase
MNVVELAPGEGWYTEILAPFLAAHGHLTLAAGNPDSPKPGRRESAVKFRQKIEADPARFGHPNFTVLELPDQVNVAPANSADLVLTFRNFHNWVSAGPSGVNDVFKAVYTALKPGGVFGIVEHRAPKGSKQDPTKTGYVTEAFVIKTAEAAGFKLVDTSEINSNPKDKTNYPEGVWTLPPTLRLKNKNRDKYLAIGESDRMTLKFIKP